MSKNHKEFAKSNPKPYQGMVNDPRTAKEDGITCSIQDAANYHDIPEIIERHEIWAICNDGIYSLYIPYIIEKNRLYEDDWIDHLSEKTWVSINDFSRALSRAKKILL